MSGKIDASLNAKLKSVEWGEYNLESLFGNSTRGKRLKSADRIAGDLPFVTAGEYNEGISAYIGNNVEIFKANTITIDMFGSTKYRSYDYGADDHIAVVHTEKLPSKAVIFITSAIHKVAHNGQFNYGKIFYAKDADSLNILLPSKNKLPDYQFMSDFIAELEVARIAELEAYLKATGLSDYKITQNEQCILDDFINNNITYKTFKIIDIFDVNNTHNILKSEVEFNSGNTPYVTAGEGNNSITSYISYKDDLLDAGNSIFIGGKTLVISYQPDDYFSNDSHNLALYIKDERGKTENAQLFMVSALYKSLKTLYSWGDSISNKKIQKDTVKLPVDKMGNINYHIMDKIITIQKKLVIKEVVLFADRKIRATKQCVNKVSVKV